jgi:hypothetical protein
MNRGNTNILRVNIIFYFNVACVFSGEYWNLISCGLLTMIGGSYMCSSKYWNLISCGLLTMIGGSYMCSS